MNNICLKSNMQKYQMLKAITQNLKLKDSKNKRFNQFRYLTWNKL